MVWLVAVSIYMALLQEKPVITRSMLVRTPKGEELVEFHNPGRWSIASNPRFNSGTLRRLAFAVTTLTLAFACGQLSAQQVLEMLQTEAGRDIAQIGKATLKDIDRTVVRLHDA